MWTYWKQRNQKRNIGIGTSSNSKYLESSEVERKPTKPLLPQEQLYSDYLDLTYTFTPSVQVICKCSHTSSSPSSPYASNILSPSPQTTKQLPQERKLVDANFTESLKQEILKSFLTAQSLSHSGQQSIHHRSLKERISDTADNNSMIRESEIQYDISKSTNSNRPSLTTLAPATPAPPSSTPTQSNSSVTKTGIWPFRKTIKVIIVVNVNFIIYFLLIFNSQNQLLMILFQLKITQHQW